MKSVIFYTALLDEVRRCAIDGQQCVKAQGKGLVLKPVVLRRPAAFCECYLLHHGPSFSLVWTAPDGSLSHRLRMNHHKTFWTAPVITP
jgi:hypothetical protein